MINKVILMGRLCADPELKTTQSGIAVCRFRIAVNRQYSKNSEKKADFINIVSWRQQAEFVSRYFRKGSMIIVEGKLQNADYTDNNGVKHYAMDVQADNVTFGETKSSQNATQSDYNSQPQNYQPTPQTAYSEPQTPSYSNPMQGVVNQSQNVVHTYEADVKNAGKSTPVIDLDDLSDFQTILGDGDVPF
jgi:single-strand DNA-binding protein